MQCAEMMKRRIRTVQTSDDVFYAARLMREHAIGFLPVCDAKGRVVGVVTDRDLALKVCAADRMPIATVVGDVMSTPVVTCRPTHPLAYAERQMRAHGVTRIVVVDNDKRVRGIISLSDIAVRGRKAEIVETVRGVVDARATGARR